MKPMKNFSSGLMKASGVVVSLALLAGCSTTAVFDSRACPQEASYTQAQLAQLRKEWAQAGPTTRRFLRDYDALGAKARACREAGR